MAISPYIFTRLAAYLIARQTMLAAQTNQTPIVTPGITYGQGGQAGASAATPLASGGTGTNGTQTALVRQLHFGTGGTVQGMSN